MNFAAPFFFEDGEDLGFRLGQQFARIGGLIVGVAEDLGRGVNEIADDRFLADDFGIPDGVGGGRHVLDDVDEERRAADHVELAGGAESLDEQRQVDVLARVVHLEHVLEELPMRGRIEVVGT